MNRLRGLLPLPVAPGVSLLVSGVLLYGGAMACGGGGSGALPAVTTTPTRSLSSQPQPSRSAAVTPAPTTAPTTAPSTTAPTASVPAATVPTATVTATATTTAPPSAAVVAPSAVTTSTPTATTAPVATSSDGGSTWGWWVLGIVLLLAVIGGIIWAILARKRKWAAWRAAAAPVAQQTHVVTDLIPVPPQRDADPAHWQQVREQAEHNAQDLESVAASAPSDDATRVTQGVARALREEVSAAEAIRLLEAAPTAPSGPQLSQAEEATRHARIDLDASQAQLDALIGPQTADAGPSTPIN